ncbi:MAG: HAD hydrolase-like protein [Thermoanaerobaculia bacterium]|nr:HAD hydrolase-like protein [Thermoanaerobaculia bacterium]
MILTFDCYGTLIDWETGIARAFQTEARKDGVELERDDLMELYHRIEPQVEGESFRRYREVLRMVALRVASEIDWEIDARRASFLPDSVPDWPIFPETNAALESLRERGWALGILSNVDDDLIAATREQFTVEFDMVITAEQVRSYKPAHGHFIEARKKIRDAPWTHVAQSYFHDIAPAKQLGIDCVWINRKSEDPSGEARPDHEYPDLATFASSHPSPM